MGMFQLPFPYSPAQRGLLARMDEEDEPRGLLGLFDRENSEPPADDGVDHEAQARWAADPVFRDARIEGLRELFAPAEPTEWDSETLAFLRQMTEIGNRLSKSAADATGYGPWAFMGPGGPTGPSATATSALARSLQRAPWAVPPAESYGQPQAGTYPGQVEVENNVYHLPPEDDLGEDEVTGHRSVRDGSKYWYPETKEQGPLRQAYLEELERIKREDPTNLEAIAKLKDPTDSFRGGAYFERTLPEDTTLYRVWGPAEGTKGGASEFGRFWTKSPPKSAVQSTIDSAIQPKWGNTFQTITSIRVPKGTTVYYGDVANHGDLVGGGWQYYLPNADPEWFIKARSFR